MTRLAFPLSLSALAVLAACATSDPVAPAPAPVVVVAPAPVTTPPAVVVPPVATVPVVVPAPAAIRAGFGRIESMTALPASAAAGGTTQSMHRLGIKMDDGTVQYVDTSAQGLSLSERVELTKDGYIRR